MSKNIPKFLAERLPAKEILNSMIDVVSDNEFSNILRYIEITGCKSLTDKFEIKLS